jgi:hypothetical protein
MSTPKPKPITKRQQRAAERHRANLPERVQTGRAGAWTVADIIVEPLTDPVNQIPRDRRFTTGARGGARLPDGSRTPRELILIDRWGLSPDVVCNDHAEAHHRVAALNGSEAVVEAVDPALAALVRAGVA